MRRACSRGRREKVTRTEWTRRMMMLRVMVMVMVMVTGAGGTWLEGSDGKGRWCKKGNWQRHNDSERDSIAVAQRKGR